MPFLVHARDYSNKDYHRLNCFSLKLHFPSLHCDFPPPPLQALRPRRIALKCGLNPRTAFAKSTRLRRILVALTLRTSPKRPSIYTSWPTRLWSTTIGRDFTNSLLPSVLQNCDTDCNTRLSGGDTPVAWLHYTRYLDG